MATTVAQYKVSISNPQSDNDEKITGSIIIEKIGIRKQATGELSGFTDGGKIGPVKGGESITNNLEGLVNEMIIKLESEVQTKYSVQVKLKFEKIENNRPTPNNPTSEQISQSPPVVALAPVLLSGKVFVKVKSGPPNGEITGVTEIDLKEPAEFHEVEFKDLQLTEPGDYVLVISSDSPLIDSLEVKVKVEKQEVVQEKEGEPEKPLNGNRPIIAQIDPPVIKIRPMTFQQDQAGPKSQGAVTDGMGYLPVVYYNGYQIRHEDIDRLSIYHDDMVPKMQLVFKDSLNIMKGSGTPMDQTYIDIFFDSNSKDIKYFHMVFKIDSFDKDREKPSQTYTIEGTINIPELFIPVNKSYEGTTFEVIREVCKELGLGFNSNITNTEDKQKWRNNNKPPIEFIEEMIKHSYITDDAYMGGYIDYYYCFNYVDINKEFKRDNSTDVMVDTVQSFDKGKKDVDKIIPMGLTTEKSSNNSTTFIIKYETVNNSTEVSQEEGFRTRTRFYDRVKKQFLEFEVDSQTSDGKKSHILKGPTEDSKLFEKNVVTKWLGKIDFLNTHKNYHYAKTQNKINLDNLRKISLNCTLPNPNYCIYKFMKINVNVINQAATQTEPMVNYRYSGSYILWSISFNFEKGKAFQELKLYRSELGKSPSEMNETKPAPKKEEPKQSNENPVTATASTPPSNSKYVQGDQYVVQDADGKKYRVTIKDVLSNGIEVIASVEEVQQETPAPSSGDVTTQVGTTDGSGGTGTSAGTTNIQPKTQTSASSLLVPIESLFAKYLVSVDGAQTKELKLINGKIEIQKNADKLRAVGKLSGFAGGGIVGPIEGSYKVSNDSLELVKEMIKKLETEVQNKYAKTVKLKYAVP